MLMASISANYQLWRLIDRELTPLAARWSGVAKLKMNNVYGVRRWSDIFLSLYYLQVCVM